MDDQTRADLDALIDELAAQAMEIRGPDLTTLLPVQAVFDRLAGLRGNDAALDAVRQIAKRGKAVLDARFGDAVVDDKALCADLGEVVEVLRSLAGGDLLAEMHLPSSFGDGPGEGPASERLMRELALPDYIDPLILGEFVERLHGLANELENGLVGIEGQDDLTTRCLLEGSVHTLKGEAGVLGLEDLSRLLHEMEDHLQNDARLPIDPLLAATDWLRAFADYASGARDTRPVNLDVLLARLGGEAGPAEEQEALDPAPSAAAASESAGVVLAEISEALDGQRDPAEVGEFLTEVTEHLETAEAQLLAIEAGAVDEEVLNTLFRSFHTIKGLAGFLGAQVIQRVAHESETLLDRCRQGSVSMQGPASDVVFEAIDIIGGQVQGLQDWVAGGDHPSGNFTMQAFGERIAAALAGGGGRVTEVSAGQFTASVVGSGSVSAVQITAAITKHGVDPEDATAVARALVEEEVLSTGEAAKAMRNARLSGEQRAMIRENIRVDADRLDRLIDLIGELVIAQTMVSQAPEMVDIQSVQLIARLGQVDKLTRELQELGTGLRMVAVRGAFQRMARLVRDLSRKLGKDVDFVMSGEDTELDKNVVDRIGDPLVHLVRNAIDHGLETDADERRRRGKSPTGRVELRAFHKGGSIYIEIADDGRGLDRERLLAKAVERGLVEPDQQLSDREVWQLIFHPGFSTAGSVSDVSGRGVGMDVVKRSIDALRGQVDISTTPGKGTCFSIRLPLTLAVIDGMVVRIGAERYIIPTLSIVSSLRPSAADLSSCLGRGAMLRWQDHLLPLLRLGELFEAPGARRDATEALCVVVEDEDRQLALQVDDLLGQQQVVIKSLGSAMQEMHGISGGAILPDGTVGLIVDVQGLMRLVDRQGAEAIQAGAADESLMQGATP